MSAPRQPNDPADPSRRRALELLATGAGLAASGSLAASATSGSATKIAKPGRMPSIFLAHGAPMTLDDPQWMAEFKAWADHLPRPKAILVLSAHWEEAPVTLGATTTVPLVYDFYGFPERFYRVTYPSPGAPELAAEVRRRVGAWKPVADNPNRGLDHGAFIPLMGMYPQADVPVLQVSLPSEDPRELFDLGQALAPLRDEGVLIMGSGFLVHNLRLARQYMGNPNLPAPSWALEFDAWSHETLAKKDFDALLDYRRRAPGVDLALPTHEHFVPVITALGAAADDGPVSFPITGYLSNIFTKRSVQFG